MRISFHVPGRVYEKDSERSVQDMSALLSLDSWRYESGNMYDYIDMRLVDEGVTGGIIRAAWIADRGLEIVIDYWAPDTLSHSHVDQLRDETAGQLSDGLGAGGFEATIGDRKLVLMPDTDKASRMEVVRDGKPVPMPSKIAQAARDGDMPLLEKSLASGEAIDSRIQGYSGLHLAIIYGHVDAALLLISRGADPNLMVGDGDETPLHTCALSNTMSDNESATVAKELLKHGADKSIVTASGKTAASFAENRHKMEMLRVLSE